jgi:chromosome partitioning protein
MPECRIVVFANQKGGVGKTSATHAFATGLVAKGFAVLAVDLDPQSNLSFILGTDYDAPTIYDLMKGALDAEKCVQRTAQCDLIGGSLMLSGADLEFNDTGREYIVAEAIEPLKERYDFIVMDSPPQLGVLTINALTAAHDVIIPMGADTFSLQGLAQLNATIAKVRKRCNPGLNIAGLLMARYNGRTVLGRELREEIAARAEMLGSRLYDTIIRDSVSVKEAQTMRESLFAAAPKAGATTDYMDFIEEYLKGRP